MAENKVSIAQRPQPQDDDISLKELITNVREWFRYFLNKWAIILIVGLLGGVVGLVYSIAKRTNYTATLNFVMEEQGASQSSLGAAAGIAAQLGFNLGGIGGSGGFFQGDNIIEFLKSRSMIDKTLLTEVEIEGKKDLLVNRYVEYNNFREKWAEKERLKGFQFADTSGVFLQDSLMSRFYKAILKKNLVIDKPDKKLNIIAIKMETPDEAFSKAFAETLIENASDFYIKTRTQKAEENLAILTHQVDSVRRELNEAIGGVAAAADANPNPNRAFQSLRVGSQRRTVDVQANTAILTELVKNQELAKITLRNEKPVIQVLDRPILPLENDKLGKVKAIIIGGVLGGFLACLVLLIRRIYRQIMEADPS
ncbi:lipopolysaccharide biosynthesis protein [Parapedobacter sp. ISTM3]|uniref:Chain length determinant protein n=1 Tax=Parapedobacter luteus TaxID=623280 RepID=A0A1T5BP11_9SPHI|nr:MULTISPECIES: lipopolysaccharide biosynthesis protein [Parapedobacter]MBK1439390.1 lipopolysaccharide biosynthesis protein [Parapedobacter sp. ISTM3]SKB48613.1 Chain length determinant protein [Parapedobacter luteus]